MSNLNHFRFRSSARAAGGSGWGRPGPAEQAAILDPPVPDRLVHGEAVAVETAHRVDALVLDVLAHRRIELTDGLRLPHDAERRRNDLVVGVGGEALHHTARIVRRQQTREPTRRQKARTRADLVDAASEQRRLGSQPTVVEATERANVSRATAHRDFPIQESLLVGVALVNPAVESVERWITETKRDDPAQSLSGLSRVFDAVAPRAEAALRTGLRVALDTSLGGGRRGEEPAAVREGRRMRWLDDALAPVRRGMRPAQWRRRRSALALTRGIDAQVVMKAVCKLPDDEALATLTWTAQAVLRAGLEEPTVLRSARKPSTFEHPVAAPSR